jgi:hypothetical protein
MPVESGDYIDDLDITQPADSEAKKFGAGYFRFLKKVIKQSFPNVTGAITATHTVINTLTDFFSISGTTVTITSTDADAAAAPVIELYRDSDTPAAADEAGGIRFTFNDSGGNKVTGAEIVGKVIAPTDGAEEFGLIVRTWFGGAIQDLEINNGVLLGGATGGLQGVGTINGTGLFVNGVATALLTMLKGFIQGWTYSNGTDATNDIDIAAGSGMDSTGVYWIAGAASTKRLDASWAVGSGNGGLDTGSIADTDYFIWAIVRSDTGVVDYLFSTSATAPTMPADYDYKRLIGSFRRSSGAILAFLTDELSGGGLRYRWDAPILDGNAVALTTSYATIALSVPAGLRVLAFGNAVAPTGGQTINIRPVGAQDGAPNHTASPLATTGSTGTSTTTGGQWREYTNTSRQIEWAASASANAYLTTAGFEWSRR